MAHITAPPRDQLPAARTLAWRALAVVVGAVVIAFVVVLPAERGVDPTGLGRLIGLTEMGIIKQEVTAEFVAESTFLANSERADSIKAAEEAAALAALASGAVPARTDTTTVVIAPGETQSIRVRMPAGAWTVFSWTTDGGVVDDDVRGDSSSAPGALYYRYRSGSERSADSGAVVAKFDGVHGWLWTNRTALPTAVRLVTRGDYSEVVIARQ